MRSQGRQMTTIPFKPRLYQAKAFRAQTDEAQSIIIMLQQARADVLANSDPLHDPRLR
jgi:hypothetical protein